MEVGFGAAASGLPQCHRIDGPAFARGHNARRRRSYAKRPLIFCSARVAQNHSAVDSRPMKERTAAEK